MLLTYKTYKILRFHLLWERLFRNEKHRKEFLYLLRNPSIIKAEFSSRFSTSAEAIIKYKFLYGKGVDYKFSILKMVNITAITIDRIVKCKVSKTLVGS